ncbi:hypothetical protein [Synechococcus sp. LTW-R]|uniref:hypothetical protein n=1 Tax=Synechococcus sp. LTW-R TaxID=2751170 RepID=UPI002103E9C3|nr:hypothetical protein [Synechococcus sp. LTW-R]
MKTAKKVDQAWKESEQIRLEKVLAIAITSQNKDMEANIKREIGALQREEPSPLIEEYLNEYGEVRDDL